MTSARHRVVVTGLGVLAPNAHGCDAYAHALRHGTSGIRHLEELATHKFGCHVGGVPQEMDVLKAQYFAPEALSRMSVSMVYAGIAAVDCWQDAGFARPGDDHDEVDWDTGAILGTGLGGVDVLASRVIPLTDQGKVRRIGGSTAEQVMNSAISAQVGGLLALGGPLSSNSSACTTGTESVAMAFEMVRSGRIPRMLAGSAEAYTPYLWASLDSMRVMTRDFNEQPERASRPLSASASGFVPGSGAGILLLESLESAQARGATIRAEIVGSFLNSGGQRQGGSITAPNAAGVQRCIRGALDDAGLGPDAVDAINGHLTATMADPLEVENWRAALERTPDTMPWIQSTKSLIGHALGGAGGLECVACVVQLDGGFLHGSLNCEDLHPQIEPYGSRVLHATRDEPVNVLAKANFGFGDVNGCVLFQRWPNPS